MKKQLLLLLIFSISLYVQGQNIHKLASPDGNIQISVNLSDKIYYDVICRNETLLKQCHLAMEIGDQELGTNPKMTKVSHKNIDESLKPVIPLKFSSVSNRYNQLLLDFKGGYSVEFRAFNDGIAYRFITNINNGKYEDTNKANLAPFFKSLFLYPIRFVFQKISSGFRRTSKLYQVFIL